MAASKLSKTKMRHGLVGRGCLGIHEANATLNRKRVLWSCLDVNILEGIAAKWFVLVFASQTLALEKRRNACLVTVIRAFST